MGFAIDLIGWIMVGITVTTIFCGYILLLVILYNESREKWRNK
jgi:hypothetical protein